jgi:hypothetical protein
MLGLATEVFSHQQHDVDSAVADGRVGVLRHPEVPAGGHRESHLLLDPLGAVDPRAHVAEERVAHGVGVAAHADVGEIRPSTDLYIVIGDIAMRLRSVTSLRVYGLNRSVMGRGPRRARWEIRVGR